MYRIGETAVAAREMRKYDINVLGISECRWAGFARMRVQTGETLLYSGRDDDAHLSGVAMLSNRKAASCLISWSPLNDQIIMARFNSRYIRTSIVQVFAPTNDAKEEAKDVFYEQVQKVLDKIPKHDIVILMGDWNAKVGDQQDGEEGVVGHHGQHGERSENGERFVELRASNNMFITTTLLPHKDIHNTAKLKVPEVAQSFKIELWNRFSCLADDEANNSDDHAQDVENDWKKIKQTCKKKTAEKVLGFQSRSSKPWISAESWKKIDDRRELKRKIDSTRSDRVGEQLRNAYSTKNKEVKKQLKKDKNDSVEKVAEEEQKAAEQGHLKTVYDATRKLSTKKGKTMDMIKSKEGVLLTKQDEIQKRWKEHFLEVLNHPAPEDTGEFGDEDVIPESEAIIDVDAPTKAEIYAVFKEMKNRTAGGLIV